MYTMINSHIITANRNIIIKMNETNTFIYTETQNFKLRTAKLRGREKM